MSLPLLDLIRTRNMQFHRNNVFICCAKWSIQPQRKTSKWKVCTCRFLCFCVLDDDNYTYNLSNRWNLVVEGYIWRFAKQRGATIFFRGIRSWQKDGPDERALQILNTWGPLLLGPMFWPIPTIYLEGNPKFNHVSSTLIRDLCSKGSEDKNALKELVPSEFAGAVSELYCMKVE